MNSSDDEYESAYDIVNSVIEPYIDDPLGDIGYSKEDLIRKAIRNQNRLFLKQCVFKRNGLISNELRRDAWPLIIANNTDYQSMHEVISPKCKEQIYIDVERTHKRISYYLNCISCDIEENQFKSCLNSLICAVLNRHSNLHYYQGYHDICLTFVLVYGNNDCLNLVENVTCNKLREYMTPTMNDTMDILKYLFPLVNILNSEVAEHIQRSGVSVVFALSWLITWFSHVIQSPDAVTRLFDAFIFCDKSLPLYTAAVVVALNADEILKENCEMAEMHHLLSKLPCIMTTEHVEHALLEACKLIDRYPPNQLPLLWNNWMRRCEEIQRDSERRARQKQAEIARSALVHNRSWSNISMSANWISRFTTASLGVAVSIFVYKELQRNPQLLDYFISFLYGNQ